MAQTVLIVDDDPVQRRLLEAAITRSGMSAVTAPGGQPALDLINGPRGDQLALMLLDLLMPDMDGLEVLAKLRGSHPDLPVIVLTAKGGIDSAVEAMRAGANDFLVKPASPERITVSIRNQLKIGALSGEVTRLKKKTDNRLSFEDLIAKSGAMRQVFRLGERAAQSNIPILIEGESGVGKELLARAIHRASARAAKPFVAVNCGAIPEALLESELFGHMKGAFTDAVANHKGLFQQADGGTLLLDEIGDMPPALQVKLLRVLQERAVRPLGGSQSIAVDVRIISATHRDLDAAMEAGQFREDLYYRLNVVTLNLPTLAERREDIPLLANHFLHKLASKYGKRLSGFAPEALKALATAPWPGNVRQLFNVVEQVCALSSSPLIPLALVQRALRVPTVEVQTYAQAKERFEREYLVGLLKLTDGNVADAARLADRNRTEFYRLLQKHDLTPGLFKSDSSTGGGDSVADERQP